MPLQKNGKWFLWSWMRCRGKALGQRFKKTAICHYCHYFDYTFTDGESHNVTPLLELTSKKGCPSKVPPCNPVPMVCKEGGWVRDLRSRQLKKGVLKISISKNLRSYFPTVGTQNTIKKSLKNHLLSRKNESVSHLSRNGFGYFLLHESVNISRVKSTYSVMQANFFSAKASKFRILKQRIVAEVADGSFFKPLFQCCFKPHKKNNYI